MTQLWVILAFSAPDNYYTTSRVFRRKGFGVVEGGITTFHYTISPFFRTQR
jgi:hypothetical protein